MVGLNARVLGVVIVCEVAVLVALILAVVLAGGADGLSVAPYNPVEIFSGNAGAMLAITISAFAGFEATVLFVEEVRSPERAIPRATYGAIALLVVLYSLVAWAIVQAYGVQGAIDKALNDPINMFFDAANRYLGETGLAIMAVLVVTSWFASVLAFHNATSRYLLALGRDRALSHRLAAISPRFGSPWVASLSHSTFTLVVVLAFGLAGADPYLDLYVLGSTPAVVAIPLMECLAAVAIVAYFSRDRHGMPAWRVIVAPTIAAIALAFGAVLIISQLDVFTTRGLIVNTLLVLVVILALVAGMARARWLRSRDPKTYAALGASNPFA